MLQIILGQVVSRLALPVTALHPGQLHHIGRHGGLIVRRIALTYQHILHVKLRLGKCIACLCKLVFKRKQIKFGYFLAFLHTVAIFYIDFCYGLGNGTEGKIGIFLRLHLAVTHQFVVEDRTFQCHHRHFVDRSRQHRLYALLFHSLLPVAAGNGSRRHKQGRHISQ